MSAGAFSIQRLEGSRLRTVVLWVLNGREERDGRGKTEWIGGKPGMRSSRKDFQETHSLTTGAAGTRVASVFE
jgi:hypothetical protein